MLFCFLSGLALADSFFSDVSEEIDLQLGGTWSIPMHDGNRWWMGMGQASDFWLAPMFEGTWFVDMTQTQNLSEAGNLRDHSFRKCSDGTFLHVSGGDVGSPNQVFRYDFYFNQTAQQEFPQSNPPHATNDVPAICGDSFDGFGIAEAQGLEDFFVEVDDSAVSSEPIKLPDSPRMTGAGLTEVDDQLIVTGMDPGPAITVSVYDLDFELVERTTIPPISDNIIHHWSSRIEKIGNYYLIATMGRDPADQFELDTGDIYLVVVDQTFETQEWLQLSFNDPEISGGMRPWFDYYEDQLVVGYDKQNSLYLFTATLNLNRFFDIEEEPEEPSPEPSTEEEETTSSTKEDEEGCGSSQALLFPVLLAFFSALRREN